MTIYLEVSFLLDNKSGNWQNRTNLSTHTNIHLSDESHNVNRKASQVNKYTNRTHTCGDLRRHNVGQKVVLCGWLEYQRMDKFLVLRDSYGETQLITLNKDENIQELLKSTSLESIIQVTGTVFERPKEMININQVTGEIEVGIEAIQVLNKAKDSLPFQMREFQKAKEGLRMKYRYLDIRFPQMQRNLRVRSKLIMRMREFLITNNFVDVETPTLFKETPGGAQEFVVPTRFAGKFFSLVQSPQQFKQMLMAGALDRYFQIARCYRDEGARSDRQPEFTQLDIELSFTNAEHVVQLIEDLMVYTLEKFCDGIPKKFPRISYLTAMEEFGSDRPDTSFDFKLKNFTHLLKDMDPTCENFGAYALAFPKHYANLSKSVKEHLSNITLQHPKAKLVQSKVNLNKDWLTKITRLISEDAAKAIMKDCDLEDGSALFLAFGDKVDVRNLLGKLRVEYVNYLESIGVTIRKKGYHFLWVLDFPLFEKCQQTGTLKSVHHPFTSPHPEDLPLLQSAPLKVRSLAYDLVLNGHEIGGGSIRIHDPSLQEQLLKALNIDQESLQHIIDMLGSGCPPHGGIALGLDRLFAILLNTISIRDVIAFPKTFEGREPISQAPSEVSEKTLKLYHIRPIDC
ncbi:aspartate--tRNA ligase, mitochondrial isoform X2 [Cylas formicarius]|uniref:aspartate--tRNA ligase, mitochondrial isoform X2 n=1 Tax=Cylas formicarius TaxID=197179 RepID=UPI002958C322|nr:aspartate--tRNA ligase, mitochondrial isoform X2 [Cylas formicarius]